MVRLPKQKIQKGGCDVKMESRDPRLIGVACLLCSFAFAFILACTLTGAMPEESGVGDDGWERIVGSAGKMLSGDLYRTADLYFHKGVGHKHETAFESFFQSLAAEVTPEEHLHLNESGNIMEIMPWLRFATAVDSRNVEAYLVAAYWLQSEGRLEDAQNVVEEARQNNPEDYRVYIGRGQLYMRMGDSQSARAAFRMAENLWPSGMDTSEEQVKLDLGQILTWRAFLCELSGDYAKAVRLLEREKTLFPSRASLDEHIESLKSGEIDVEALRRHWKRIVSGKEAIGGHHTEHHHHHE